MYLIFNRDDANPSIAELSSYHYVPTEWICALFVSLFGLSTLVHVGQAFYFRLWFLLPTAGIAGILEIIGWSARLWSSKNPLNDQPFLIQISTTIIAPTPLVAANFILLGRIISRLGPRYSRLSARWYTGIFLTCDIVALIVQAAGGGIASGSEPDLGGNIMLGGIVFQLVAIICYVALAAEFLFRYINDRPIGRRNNHFDSRVPTTQRMKLMLAGMTLMTIFIFIRSIYRTIELSDGWSGTVISTQWLFNVFDGAMIVLAFYTLNVLHPGILLVPEEKTLEISSNGSVSPLANGMKA
ncbi:RTA1-domain-containing protein [Amylostereum chailletii]|nr:RTA1-domain-containing protein [Amylostereum chailletii]